MRTTTLLALTLALATAGCGATSNVAGPSGVVSVTGTWSGSATDSTGTMMGAGLSPSMMSTMTWNVTQTGTSFNGTVQFAGYQGGTMRVTGDVMDHSATFTLSMPMGSMPMTGSACAATATGTIDMDDMVARMQGTYAGTNTCTGPFDRGQLSMTRRQ